MGRQSTGLRSPHPIVATAIGLVLLVSVALGWLGWRLLEKEEALQNQQQSDVVLTGFLRRIQERKLWLSRLDSMHSSGPGGSNQPDSAGILVSFSNSGILIQPPDQLVYYPALPQPPAPDTGVFEQATKLEFQQTDLKAAAVTLSTLAESNDGSVRAEALWRLARVQKNDGQTLEALSTYTKLQDETRIGPLEEPYGLSSRIVRFELLEALHENAKAQQEASVLLAGLETGRWPVGKGSFAAIYPKIHKVAGDPASSNSLDAKLAIAEAVESAWDEWKIFQRSGSRSVSKVWQKSDPVAALVITDANTERMVSLIYAGDAMRSLGLEDTSLTDENGRMVFGPPLDPKVPHSTQSLSAAGLSWQLHVAASTNESVKAFSKERRNYLVFTLIVIVVLVFLACYALARGVLREQAAGRLQSDFVSAVSHEFRSPLTTLRQLTELLAEGRISEKGRLRQYFSVLQQETARLNLLVENLLDFGRIEAGRQQYELEPVEFAELVRDGIEDYERHAGTNGHRIEVGSCQGPLLVQADREAIGRVVRNLLENAVKYSPKSTTVWVDACREGDAAVLRVRDEGIGIPPEERSGIFEKFVRGEGAKKACIPGTGVGLAMVKEIVRVHRGDLDLSSEVGRGSTFVVRLPLDGSS